MKKIKRWSYKLVTVKLSIKNHSSSFNRMTECPAVLTHSPSGCYFDGYGFSERMVILQILLQTFSFSTLVPFAETAGVWCSWMFCFRVFLGTVLSRKNSVDFTAVPTLRINVSRRTNICDSIRVVLYHASWIWKNPTKFIVTEILSVENSYIWVL